MYTESNLIASLSNESNFDLELTDSHDLDFNTGTLSDQNFINNNSQYYFDLSNNPTLPIRTEKGFTLNFWVKKSPVITSGNVFSSQFSKEFGSNTSYVNTNIFSSEFSKEFKSNNSVNDGKEFIFVMGSLGATESQNTGIGVYYNQSKMGMAQIDKRVINETGSTVSYVTLSEFPTKPIYTNKVINLSVVFNRNSTLKLCDDIFYPEPVIIPLFSEDCVMDIPDSQKGVLTFYINGNRVYEKEVEEPLFNNLNIISIKNPNDIISQFIGSFKGLIYSAGYFSFPLNVPQIKINYRNTSIVNYL